MSDLRPTRRITVRELVGDREVIATATPEPDLLADFEQIKDYLDSRMRFMVRLAEEEQGRPKRTEDP